MFLRIDIIYKISLSNIRLFYLLRLQINQIFILAFIINFQQIT